MKIHFKAHFALLGTSIIFGVNYWIAKGLMPGYMSPFQLVIVRIAGAALLFWLVSLLMKPEKVTRRDLLIIALASLFGTTINQLLFFTALNLTSPVDVSLIHVSNPIFVLVFAAILIRERISLRKVLGIVSGATGALILIFYHRTFNIGSSRFVGNLLAMINMMGYAVYLVIIKPVMARYSLVTVMKWVFLFGFVFTAPLTLGSLGRLQLSAFDLQSTLSVVYVVVATTFLAYLLTLYALQWVDASVAGFYIYLQPLIVAIIAFWLGRQPMTWEKAMAAALIFLGVYLVSKKRKPMDMP